MSVYSGVPLTITTNVNPSNALGSTNTPDLVAPIIILGNVQANNPATGGFANCAATDSTCHYFQASSFAQVPAASATQARYGTAGRNILRGPGFFDLDTALLRDFPITERLRFQFRVSAFAVTNTPNFGNPQTNISQSNFGVITGTASGPQFSSEAGNLSGQRTGQRFQPFLVDFQDDPCVAVSHLAHLVSGKVDGKGRSQPERVRINRAGQAMAAHCQRSQNF